MTKIIMCLLLLGAASAVSARDVRMHGANGDGGACPEAAVTTVRPATSALKHAPVAINRGKVKAPTPFRAGGDDELGVHAPRWHSFLPGMFR